ncbi:MAG: hypothetical protein HY291_18075 [Planctomycetes bacterium]|nr:hypothetical protein [Planctomycetota bacterium]
MQPKALQNSFLLSGLLFLSQALGAETSAPQPNVPSEITKLVCQLGDDEYDTREAAEIRLLQIGEPAAVEIERACSSSDPELSYRARRLRPHVRVAPCLRRLQKFSQSGFCWEADLLVEASGPVLVGRVKAKGPCFAFEGTWGFNEKEGVQPVRIVSDGQTVWIESTSLSSFSGGSHEKGVVKISLKEFNIQNLWPFLFEKLFEKFEFTGTSERNSDGVSVIVLEGNSKTFENEMILQVPDFKRVRILIPKEKATFVQLESFNSKNERIEKWKLSQIRAGKPPGEKDFIYQPPEGVSALDLTEYLKVSK